MSDNILSIGKAKVYLAASPKPINHDTLRPLTVTELRDAKSKGKVINPNSARSMAYRDLYGLLFFLENDRAFHTVGDKTVTSSFIELGLLIHDSHTNLISRGTGIELLRNSGPLRSEKDGRTYQAILILRQ